MGDALRAPEELDPARQRKGLKTGRIEDGDNFRTRDL
jgi:hypothetical protein